MNMNMAVARPFLPRKTIPVVAALAALLMPLSAIGGEPHGAPRGEPARGGDVGRYAHGSVRHANTYVVQHPIEVRREPEHHVEVRREAPPPAFVHPWREEEVHHPHFWDNFVFGLHLAALPFGCITLQIGGVPYYYDNGIYYQALPGGYQEVYPPVGAVIPQPPDGAIAVEAGGVVYYYAGGAFYLQQPDGTYALAPPPLGVVVPLLPPGAVQVVVNGNVAYQFNGIYYQPVFVNGATQYETFRP